MQGLGSDWEQARVGMHWTRSRDGRKQIISTWACGDAHGYSLTENFEQTNFATVEEAAAEADRRWGRA